MIQSLSEIIHSYEKHVNISKSNRIISFKKNFDPKGQRLMKSKVLEKIF